MAIFCTVRVRVEKSWTDLFAVELIVLHKLTDLY